MHITHHTYPAHQAVYASLIIPTRSVRSRTHHASSLTTDKASFGLLIAKQALDSSQQSKLWTPSLSSSPVIMVATKSHCHPLGAARGLALTRGMASAPLKLIVGIATWSNGLLSAISLLHLGLT